MPRRGRKIARVFIQSYNPEMPEKFLEVVIAFVVKEIKMPPRRRVVKRCRKNVIYFLLRFSPIAQCVNRF